MTKQVIVSKDMIPEDWSVEAADFINRLLIRKAANRLGLLGAGEVKEHIWLKGFKWKDLYDRKLSAPFIPKGSDNFDSKYCNANDKLSEQTKLRYEMHLREEKNKLSFNDFDFIPGHSSKLEFVNPHLNLSNTGAENVLIERQNNEQEKKSYQEANKIQQNMPTTFLIKQYQKKTSIAYKKKNNSISNSAIKASGLGLSNYSKINNSNTNMYINNDANCSAYLENH